MELSERELTKAIDAFRVIVSNSTIMISNLEFQLLKEVRTSGNTNYSTALSNSIQLETQYLNIANVNLQNYRTRLYQLQSKTVFN